MQGLVQGLARELVWKQALPLGSFQPCPTCDACEVNWVEWTLNRVVNAGGEFSSFNRAARMLGILADVNISGMQVSRLTGEIGEELGWRGTSRPNSTIAANCLPPPRLQCRLPVQVDGGRIQTRSADARRGLHDPRWKASKVACLWRMDGQTRPVIVRGSLNQFRQRLVGVDQKLWTTRKVAQ